MTSHKTSVSASRQNIYLVLDDFGALGRSYRETDENEADHETLIREMMEGQFNAPVRVIAFNLAEGWIRDVSADVAVEIDCRVRRTWSELCPSVARFVEEQLEVARRCRGSAQTPASCGAPSASAPPWALKLVTKLRDGL